MVASNPLQQSIGFRRVVALAVGAVLSSAILMPAGQALATTDDATVDPAPPASAFPFDPFDMPQEVDFDSFEDQESAVQQVAHIAPQGTQQPKKIKSLSPVEDSKTSVRDPFEEVAWAAPLSDSDYAPPKSPSTAPRATVQPTALPVAPAGSIPSATSIPTAPTAGPNPSKTRPAEFAFKPSTDVIFTQSTQLELLEPRDQQQTVDSPDDAQGYAQSARDWRPKPLDQLTINISQPAGTKPHDYAGDRPIERWPCDPTLTRCWPMLGYQWAATCLCYQPLYFEEINLERYGYGCHKCLQPAASAAHFFGTVPILPYCMAVNCPGDCNYTLGEYRPGSCAPWRTQCAGPSFRGGWAEAATVVGLVLLIP